MQVKNITRPEYFVICRDGRIYWWCRFEMNNIAKSIPGARWNKELKAWEYPATPAVGGLAIAGVPPTMIDSTVSGSTSRMPAMRPWGPTRVPSAPQPPRDRPP